FHHIQLEAVASRPYGCLLSSLFFVDYLHISPQLELFAIHFLHVPHPFALLRSREHDHPVDHFGSPQTCFQLPFICFIRVVESVKHRSEGNLPTAIIDATAGTERSILDISLAFPSSKEYVSPPAF